MTEDGAEGAAAQSAAGGGAAPEIDVEKLADKVYRLLQAEIRLGRSRGEMTEIRAGRRRRSST